MDEHGKGGGIRRVKEYIFNKCNESHFKVHPTLKLSKHYEPHGYLDF